MKKKNDVNSEEVKSGFSIEKLREFRQKPGEQCLEDEEEISSIVVRGKWLHC